MGKLVIEIGEAAMFRECHDSEVIIRFSLRICLFHGCNGLGAHGAE